MNYIVNELLQLELSEKYTAFYRSYMVGDKEGKPVVYSENFVWNVEEHQLMSYVSQDFICKQKVHNSLNDLALLDDAVVCIKVNLYPKLIWYGNELQNTIRNLIFIKQNTFPFVQEDYFFNLAYFLNEKFNNVKLDENQIAALLSGSRINNVKFEKKCFAYTKEFIKSTWHHSGKDQEQFRKLYSKARGELLKKNKEILFNGIMCELEKTDIKFKYFTDAAKYVLENFSGNSFTFDYLRQQLKSASVNTGYTSNIKREVVQVCTYSVIEKEIMYFVSAGEKVVQKEIIGRTGLAARTVKYHWTKFKLLVQEHNKSVKVTGCGKLILASGKI